MSTILEADPRPGRSYVNPSKPVQLGAEIAAFYEDAFLRGVRHPPKGVDGASLRPEGRQRSNQQTTFIAGDPDYTDGYVANEAAVSSDLCHATVLCSWRLQVGKDFIAFLLQFYRRFPQMAKVDLHLSSESYGGHFLPGIGAEIALYNRKNEGSIPLKTLAIGNQWSAPSLRPISTAWLLSLIHI